MKKKTLLLSIIFSLVFSVTGCSSPKETKTEFENFGEFIENISEWDFKEENFKDSDFERCEDEDYNPDYSSFVKIGDKKDIFCSYQFEDNKLIRTSLNQTVSDKDEAIDDSEYIIKQLKKYCNMYVQEATNTAIQDYTNDPTYAFRIDNEVDPMNNIRDMIENRVDGGEHSIIFRSKNGEFKDICFTCSTEEDIEGASLSVVISNVKGDPLTSYYSEEY